MKIAILNDTGGRSNWGCQVTSKNLLGYLANRLGSEGDVTFIPVPFPEKHRVDRLVEGAYGDRIRQIYSASEISEADLKFLDDLVQERFADAYLSAREADAFFFQGEGSIGPSRFFRNVTLYGLPLIAKMLWRKPVMSLNQTLYAGSESDAAALVAIFRRFDVVAVREFASYSTFKQHIPELILCPDMAFNDQLSTGSSPLSPGNFFCVAGSAAHELLPAGEFVRVITAVAERHRLVPVFLSSTAADSRFFKSIWPDLASAKPVLIDKTVVPRAADLLPLLRDAKFLLGGRYHTAISALTQYTPVIMLPGNTYKLEGIGPMLGLPLPVIGVADFDAALRMVEDCVDNNDGQRRQIGLVLSRNREKFDALATVLKDVTFKSGSGPVELPPILQPAPDASYVKSPFDDAYRSRNTRVASLPPALSKASLFLERHLPGFRDRMNRTLTKLP